MKTLLVSLLATGVLIAAPLSATAADKPAPQKQKKQTPAPLSAGGPAGVKKAQGNDNLPLEFWVGGGLVVVLGAVAVVQNDKSVTTTNTGTSP